MGSRKVIIVIAALIIGSVAALIETQMASGRRVQLVEPAAVGLGNGTPFTPVQLNRHSSTSIQAPASTAAPQPPVSPLFTTSVAPAPASTSDATATSSDATSAAPAAPLDRTNLDGDLRSSQERLNAIDRITQGADHLFSAAGIGEPSMSVNPQGLDQLDYQTPDGNITAWFDNDDQGVGVVKAQEAQLANGEVVDRWFGDSGTVEQVMHQYDRDNSYSVYYYSTGEVEATRVVRNGTEIFTRYDRDGRQLQRTVTPASP